MKTIFVFDDSRVTDDARHIIALSEEGQGVALIKFDDWTLPYRHFAMGITQDCDATGSVAETVNRTHGDIVAAYNLVFGAGNWIAVWIEHPTQDPMCLEALRAMHAKRQAYRARQRETIIDNLARALSPFGEPAVESQFVH